MTKKHFNLHEVRRVPSNSDHCIIHRFVEGRTTTFFSNLGAAMIVCGSIMKGTIRPFLAEPLGDLSNVISKRARTVKVGRHDRLPRFLKIFLTKVHDVVAHFARLRFAQLTNFAPDLGDAAFGNDRKADQVPNVLEELGPILCHTWELSIVIVRISPVFLLRRNFRLHTAQAIKKSLGCLLIDVLEDGNAIIEVRLKE